MQKIEWLDNHAKKKWLKAIQKNGQIVMQISII